MPTSGTVTVQLHEANFRNIVPQATIAILGKRRTGKTQYAMYLTMHLARNIDRILCMCGNKDNMREWEKVLHPLLICEKSLEKLAQLVQYQDRKIYQSRKEWEQAGYNLDDYECPRSLRVLVIIDDCGNDKSFMHSAIMKDIASNGRHYGMDVLILAQYLNQLAAENRDQLDYIGVLQTTNAKNIEKVFREYVSEFICPKRTWNYLLGACTGKKGSMCWIENADPSNSTLATKIFYKHMPWPVKWRNVVPPAIRKYCRRHYYDRIDPTQPSHPIDDTMSQVSSVSQRSAALCDRVPLHTAERLQGRRYIFKENNGPTYNIHKIKRRTDALSSQGFTSVSRPQSSSRIRQRSTTGSYKCHYD